MSRDDFERWQPKSRKGKGGETMDWKNKERLLEEVNRMWEIFALTVRPDQEDKIGPYLEAKERLHGILANDKEVETTLKVVGKASEPEDGARQVGVAWLGIDRKDNAVIVIQFFDGQYLLAWEGKVERVNQPSPTKFLLASHLPGSA